MSPRNLMGPRVDQDGWSKTIEMEDVMSSGSSRDQSSLDRSQTPTQSEFSNNPPLSESRHNPQNSEPGFLAAIAEIFAHPNSDGSIFINAEKVKTLSPLLAIEKIASVQTLSAVEKITKRLDSMEKSINSVVHPEPKNGPSWASAAKKNAAVIPHSVVARPPPSNRVLNEFKPAFFVIRKSIPNSRPFFQMSPLEIINKVNDVLKDIEAVTMDGSNIKVKGVARLPSGDFKFFTQTRFAANWLLEHKHEWTHLCDSTLVTPASTFPVILHSVPISFTPSNKSTLAELCRENKIHPDHIHSARWLGNPQASKKSHGSLIVNFFDKDLARKIEKGSLFYNYLPLTGAHYKKSPLQCFQCLEIGHTAQICKNTPLCKHCGNPHNSKDCQSDIGSEKCVKCIQYEKKICSSSEFDDDNVRFYHSPLSLKCPLKTKNFRQKIVNQ
ncbi:hypothetical protein PTTG_10281 [Puccinia triticina 1-1 BBBD Race 1]|uniref:CCHC-type domain-containing protein n=1 Tax=Puccinia triticina (isolate 1-1 / race 1 (BBBD)) TaxID=630390 RepID=A0A0C4FAN8_PUCT1|nr:hypothetical protein PTTG_10281 [Puccinia triticina 1-1 BBBD Race 1]